MLLILTPWILTIVLLTIIALIFLVELEYFTYSTFLMIVTITVAQFFHVIDVLGWLRQNYISTLAYIVGYLVLGVLWSLAKWIFFLQKFNLKRLEAIAHWQSTLKSDARADNTDTSLASWKFKSYKNTRLSHRPIVAEYKGTIIAWMLWWPISMIGTFLNDPVREFFSFMYEELSGLYQKIADKMVSDIEKK